LKTWIGADPGGIGNFGVCILQESGSTITSCVDSVEEAVDWVVDNVSDIPVATAIDAPLWWSAGPGGGRKADKWIREKYGISSGTVQSVNSLRGAALAQGMLFASLLRERYPDIVVSEAHPKAVLKAINIARADFPRLHSVEQPGGTEHESDALIAAVAAREGLEGRWPLDLSTSRFTSEQDPMSFWLAPVSYFWPGV
jgi:predicted nuclease with RNAse H fold